MDGHGNDADKNNGNSVASGAQGIYSSPELTIDANKISQGPSDNRSRVASVFANTDAGQRSQKLNNAMGVSSQPATEDIMLNNGPRKRSKAPLIVVLILLILAGVGVGAYFLVNSLNNNPSGPQTSIAENAKKDFNRYATYLLRGESSDELDGEYSSAETYKLSEAVFDPETIDSSYWTKVTELLDTTIKTYSEAEDADESLKELLQNDLEMIKFLQAYAGITVPDEDTFIEQFITSGTEAAQTYITVSYLPIQNLNSNIANLYLESIHSQYNDLVGILEIYSNNSCITDGQPDDVCAANLSLDLVEQIETLSFSSAQAETAANYLVENAISQLEISCWQTGLRFTATTTDDAENEQ